MMLVFPDINISPDKFTDDQLIEFYEWHTMVLAMHQALSVSRLVRAGSRLYVAQLKDLPSKLPEGE